jgi:hypothetical protein
LPLKPTPTMSLNKLINLSFCISCFLTSSYSLAQDYYAPGGTLTYADCIYKKNIKSVQLHKDGYEFSAPIIRLGSNELLKLSFDELTNETKTYRYTFIHCDANWNPSTQLLPSQYLSGFYDNSINDYQYSKNTFQKYVHYEALFPNENIKPLLSGNYLLKVFLEEEVVLTKRFMVVEERVLIIPSVHRASRVEESDYKQEVDFTIQTGGYSIINPYNDLKVVITQNDRWDNAITKLKPLFVKNDELVYDFDFDNVFSGGNEFRNFNIKSIYWNSEFVKQNYRDSAGYHAILFPSKKRSLYQYLSDQDVNGKYIVSRQESSLNASATEAEYVYVHFSIKMEEMENGNVYVVGGFNQWEATNENKAFYNSDLSQYENIQYLKQGYYNYLYLFLQDGKKTFDEAAAEGQHYETENDYTIYVYYKPMSSNHDQLIGVKRFNSLRR